tara:strand:- start:336 stop:2078 length:1743 start_codon:yes stop_codon:yes gene_type:complete
MGTYRKPASLVDTQSGKISRATTEKLSANFNKILQVSLAQSKIRAKQKEESDKAIRKIYSEEATRLSKGNSVIENSTINAQSIQDATRRISMQTANSRIQLLSAGGLDPDTEGFYKANQRAAAGMTYFNGLTESMAKLEASDSQIATDISKGVGSKAGMISAASVKDSRFLEAYSPGTGWEKSYGAELGDDEEYHDYLLREKDGVKIKDYANFLGGSTPETTFNRVSYRINPDVVGGTQTILKELKILNSDSTPADMFIKKSTTEDAGEVPGRGFVQAIYNVESIDSDKLYSSVDAAASGYGELIIKNGVGSMLDLLQEKGIGESIPGSDAIGYRFFKRNKDGSIYKNAEGKAEREDKPTPITNQFGEFIIDPENNSPDTAFLNDDEYDGFMRMVHEISANGAGAFSNPKRELDATATERLIKSRASTTKATKPTDIQLKSAKTQGTIDRAFENLKANVAEIQKTKSTKRSPVLVSGIPIKASDIDEKDIIDAFRKEMGGLITPNINFEIREGKFYPVREKLRKEVEDGEETMFKDYVPIIDEGYNIFTEMDKIKTYLEEEFIPIEVRTASTRAAKYNTK